MTAGRAHSSCHRILRPAVAWAVVISALWLAATATGGGATGRLAQADPNSIVDPVSFQDLRWRSVGPARGGRVTAIAGVRSRPNVFYMGATGGGVWKSENYGVSWRPVTDGQIATGSVGAIDVAESNPDVVYVGTGSAAIRSNVIIGRGVYKSTDGGETWRFAGLRDAGQIGSVAVHPADPDVVWLAALGSPYGPTDERGVFKTTDGGATWRKVLFVNRETGARVVAINPRDPTEVYAGMHRAFRKGWDIVSGGPASEGGIYKSRDGGETWTKLSAGLPRTLIGRIDLDVSRSDPRIVYAMVEAPGDGGGLYRSDDAGSTWRIVNNDAGLRFRPFYFHYVDVNPRNENEVWVSELRLWKSTDGGRTFASVPTPHGDNHGVWFNPDNPSIVLQANDGGANVSQDGGRSWSSILNQPTGEFYMVAVDEQFPYRLYAPQQDNSTVIVPSLPPVAWRLDRPEQIWDRGPGCETGQIHPRADGRIVYGACKGEFGRYSVETGQEQHYWVYPQNRYGHNPGDIRYRFPRQSVIVVSPHDPRVIYHASHVVHRTTDEGATWNVVSPDLTAGEPDKQVTPGTPITRDITGEEVYSAIYSMAESRLERGVLWVGANDGPVHVSRDGARTWTDVTPAGLPPGGRVQTIEDSPHRRGAAYVAVHRYLREHDLSPYIYATDDYGRTWRRLADGRNGIPADHPTRVVREDPEVSGLLYAGTEFGIFVSFDGGAHWQPLQQNLPATPVTDIRIHRRDLVVATMGRSLWIMDDVSPLQQIAGSRRNLDSARVGDQGEDGPRRPSADASGGAAGGGNGVADAGFDPGAPAYLFQPRDVHRMRYEPLPGRPGWPEYPLVGARIDYHLGGGPPADLQLEILDPADGVIRTFAPASAPGASAGRSMRAPRSGGGGMTALPARRGMNRFVWDLRHDGAWSVAHETNAPDGPLAVPGLYRARLTAGGRTQTRTFEVRLDPRVAADGVTAHDLRDQLDLLLKLRDAIGEARKLAERLREARDRTADAAGRAALAGLIGRLVTAPGPYPQPMLIDQLANVARMLGQADQKPGRDAWQRFDDLAKDRQAIEAEAGGALESLESRQR